MGLFSSLEPVMCVASMNHQWKSLYPLTVADSTVITPCRLRRVFTFSFGFTEETRVGANGPTWKQAKPSQPAYTTAQQRGGKQ